MNGCRFHSEALADLDEIWSYIAFDSADLADALVDEILSAVESLGDFPEIGHRRRDLTERPVRFLTIRQYLVAYAYELRPIFVLAIVHGRRDPRVLAALLRGRE